MKKRQLERRQTQKKNVDRSVTDYDGDDNGRPEMPDRKWRSIFEYYVGTHATKTTVLLNS